MEGTSKDNSVSRHRVLNVWLILWTSIILVSSPSAVFCQSVTITSNISEGEIVCPGKTVTFKCVTRVSAFHRWASDEYIGGLITFDTADPLNSPRTGTADPNTIATLLNDTVENNARVLVSELCIIASSVSLTPSVTCDRGAGTEERFSFRVQGEPGVPQVTIADNAVETCQLNISLAGFTTGDTIQVFVNGLYFDNVTSSDSVPPLNVSYVVPGCEFQNVSARIVDRCGREGQFSPIVTFDPEQSSEPVTSTLPATPRSTDDGRSPSSSGIAAGVVAAIVVVIAVLVIAALVVFVVMIVLCYCLNNKKSTPKRVSDIHLESKSGDEDTKLKES